jgi:hypothetical protein
MLLLIMTVKFAFSLTGYKSSVLSTFSPTLVFYCLFDSSYSNRSEGNPQLCEGQVRTVGKDCRSVKSYQGGRN